jgi:hypothetical protein
MGGGDPVTGQPRPRVRLRLPPLLWVWAALTAPNGWVPNGTC